MAAPAKFQFLKLAKLPKLKILQHLDTMDLFELSLLSRRAQAAVKAYCVSRAKKIEMDVFNFYQVRITKDILEPVLDAQFPSPRTTKTQDCVPDRTLSLNGKAMEFGVYDERFYCITDKQQESMLTFIDYFKKVFNCKLYDLRISLKDTDNIDIYFTDPFFKKATSLDVGYGGCTEDEMTRFFDHFPAKQKKFSCYPGKAYQYDKPISLDIFYINQAQWMDRSNLLNLNCEKVEIRKSHFKSEDFNAFLISWMMTDNHKLEYLCIIGEAAEDFLDINKAMEGVLGDAGRQKRYNATSYRPQREPHPDFQIGMDIRRKTDGMLATVLIDELPGGLARFLLVAWHVLDPNWE